MRVKPSELKKIRRKMGITQAALGVELGKSIKTVQAYEYGFRSIPDVTARLIRILADHPSFKARYPVKESRKR